MEIRLMPERTVGDTIAQAREAAALYPWLDVGLLVAEIDALRSAVRYATGFIGPNWLGHRAVVERAVMAAMEARDG
jgi:hypothetical protein